MISAILRDAPPSVTDRRGDLPPHLARIVRRCLDQRRELLDGSDADERPLWLERIDGREQEQVQGA